MAATLLLKRLVKSFAVREVGGVVEISFLVSGVSDLVVVGCGFSLSGALHEGHMSTTKDDL